MLVDDREDRRITKYLDYPPIVEWPEMKGAPLLDFNWSRKPKTITQIRLKNHNGVTKVG